MRLVIDDNDFRRLTPKTQRELIEVLGRKRVADLRTAARPASYYWRRPIDLTPDLANRLMHGLAENHRRRLELFARHGGRVTMKQLLAVTRDRDLRVLSYFQGAVTRKLRRILDDQEKIVHLIDWDFDSTKWDKDHKTIVNGVYYVTRKTTRSLQRYFDTA